MVIDLNRRKAIKYGFAGLAGFLASIATATLDESQGFKAGEMNLSPKAGKSEGRAVCGNQGLCVRAGASCQCGRSMNCSGSGG
jgi:hypothetical protein